MARSTLSAMLSQEIPLPYDVWLCDESPSMEIIDWCDEHGVTSLPATAKRTITARAGRGGQVQGRQPRLLLRPLGLPQLRCRRPARLRPPAIPPYLAEVVRPFSDPAIGYVALRASATPMRAPRGRRGDGSTVKPAFTAPFSSGTPPAGRRLYRLALRGADPCPSGYRRDRPRTGRGLLDLFPVQRRWLAGCVRDRRRGARRRP